VLKLNKFFEGRGIKEVSLEFPKQILANSQIFNIEVNIVKKKNSSVTIKGNKLNFRLSSYLKNSELKNHFDELLDKIRLKIEKMDLNPIDFDFLKFIEKGYFIFSAKRFNLEISNKISGVKFKDDTFYYNATLDIEVIEKRVIKKLISLYETRLEKYVEELNSNTYKYYINSFKLKNLNSKWGHCTSNNDIMLNIKLLNSSKEVLDYVIIHELAHIKHKNHSNSFWREVERFCPNHRMLRKELREKAPQILN
jgi:predicted metal-dependent hydrolase